MDTLEKFGEYERRVSEDNSNYPSALNTHPYIDVRTAKSRYQFLDNICNMFGYYERCQWLKERDLS